MMASHIYMIALEVVYLLHMVKDYLCVCTLWSLSRFRVPPEISMGVSRATAANHESSGLGSTTNMLPVKPENYFGQVFGLSSKMTNTFK